MDAITPPNKTRHRREINKEKTTTENPKNNITMPTSAEEALQISKRQTHNSEAINHGQFGHTRMVMGPASNDSTSEWGVVDGHNANRLNGIIREPTSFYAQFTINYIPPSNILLKGKNFLRRIFNQAAITNTPVPLIVTLASHDPDNLGTYDQDSDKYVLTEDNIKKRTYLISALPPTAPLTYFQKAIADYNKVLTDLAYELNLTSHSETIDGKFSNVISAKHVTYRTIEVEKDKHIVLKRYGPSKIGYYARSIPHINQEEIKQNIKNLKSGKALPETEFLKYNKGLFFPNSGEAFNAIAQDYDKVFTRLWNGEFASRNPYQNLKSQLKQSLRDGTAQEFITGGIVKMAIVTGLFFAFNDTEQIIEILRNNEIGIIEHILSKPSQLFISACIALSLQATQSVFDVTLTQIFKQILNPFHKQSKADAHLNQTQETIRDYTDRIARPPSLKDNRGLLKIAPRYIGAERLKAVYQEDNDDHATTIHLPLDNATDVKPLIEGRDHENPVYLSLANNTVQLLGTLTRSVARNILLTPTPLGLVTLSVNSQIPEHKNGYAKANTTTLYIGRVTSYAVPAFTGDVEADEQNNITPPENEHKNGGNETFITKPFSNITEDYYQKVTQGDGFLKIEINRKQASFTVSTISREDFAKAFRPDTEESKQIVDLYTPPNKDDMYMHGLQYGPDAHRRMLFAFGYSLQEMERYIYEEAQMALAENPESKYDMPHETPYKQPVPA